MRFWKGPHNLNGVWDDQYNITYNNINATANASNLEEVRLKNVSQCTQKEGLVRNNNLLIIIMVIFVKLIMHNIYLQLSAYYRSDVSGFEDISLDFLIDDLDLITPAFEPSGIVNRTYDVFSTMVEIEVQFMDDN